MKMKNCLYQLFITACVLGFLAAAPLSANAANASSTFPTTTAGIAAYVKLDPLSLANFENAKSVLFDSVESFGSKYMIGVKEYVAYSADGNNYGKTNFHIYLGADGWLVAYLLSGEEPSRIVNWNATTLSDTMLKTIIGDAMGKINATTKDSIKYYDFSNPKATKMTFIKEFILANEVNAATSEPILTDNFSVTMPGTLRRASWAMMCINCSCPYWGYPIGLSFDDNTNLFVGGGCGIITYGNYDNYYVGLFNDRANHKVGFRKSTAAADAFAVSVLLYSNNWQ